MGNRLACPFCAVSGARGAADDETPHYGRASALPGPELGALESAAGLRRPCADREPVDSIAPPQARTAAGYLSQGSEDHRGSAVIRCTQGAFLFRARNR